MAALLGNITLWLSLIFGITQFIVSSNKNFKNILFYNKIAVTSLLLSTLICFFSLMFCFIVSDFSILNVFQNSHSTKPLIYKITGVWGNHEGSMLLWVLVLTIINYLIYRLYNKKNIDLISDALQIQALITIGFLLFIIFTSNPFVRMEFKPSDGLGFNPILQDPALAIHPPLLYVGYVGFSAAFSISIATMRLKGNNNIPWYKYMKFFVAIAWAFLTVGIAFGSIWAYYELGWGGWWFWDPVENAALMPWLIGTALFHSLITVEKKKSLQSWVLLLAILSFLLSMIGTFLVRSGILTSVHTFALDPSRGIYILSFIALLGGYSLILFFLKSKNFYNQQYFYFFSREGAILTNNIIMVIVCASIFFGTTYPLFVEIFSNNRISVGEPYFNSTIVPITIPAIIVMGIGPILSWGNISFKKIIKAALPSLLISIIIIYLFFLVYKSYNFSGLIGIGLSAWIISNILVVATKKLINYFYSNRFSSINIVKQSTSMIVAHLGIGLLILGITGSSVWKEEVITQIKVNEEIKIVNYKIIFDKIIKIDGPNYIALQGNFSVFNKNNKLIASLKPENRFYEVTNATTTEASIHTNLLRDLYIVLGDGDLSDGWIIRIYYNPLVIWIWIGAIITFIGGLISIINNKKVIKN